MDIQVVSSIYVIGDIHGQYEQLIGLLLSAGLVGFDLAWAGANATLWFMGDLLDRQPDGIEVIDLVMRLQGEAAAAGGQVASVLGNHEVIVLAAQRFGGHFIAEWEQNGGNVADLTQLTPQHTTWIAQLPAMVCVGDRLLLHANASFYTHYGRSVVEVNQACKAVLQCDDPGTWDRLLDMFCARGAFDDKRVDGVAHASQFLRAFSVRQLIHGHTPISFVSHLAPEDVTNPLVYAGDRCVNVDGGIYLGGPGFVHQIPL